MSPGNRAATMMLERLKMRYEKRKPYTEKPKEVVQVVIQDNTRWVMIRPDEEKK